MKELVDQLKRNRTLSPEELRLLLTDASPEEREYLHRAAREVARVHFGNGVFVRGLIEISNYCRNAAATAAFDAAIVWQNATV